MVLFAPRISIIKETKFKQHLVTFVQINLKMWQLNDLETISFFFLQTFLCKPTKKKVNVNPNTHRIKSQKENNALLFPYIDINISSLDLSSCWRVKKIHLNATKWQTHNTIPTNIKYSSSINYFYQKKKIK